MGRLLHFDSEQHRAGCCALCHDRGDSAVAALCGQGTVSGHHISDIGPLSAGTGAGVYWTAYYIVTNELDKASQTGYMALKVAVAIVLGIVFVFELPQGIFRVFSKKEEKQGNPRSR